MTTIKDPALPSDNARQRLYDGLQSGLTIVWYSKNATDHAILMYVLRLLGLNRENLKVTNFGYGVDRDECVVLIRLRGDQGSAVCVHPLNSTGIERINEAISTEHEETMVALSRGEFSGNLSGDGHASHSALKDGAIHPDWEGSDVLDYIHDSDVIHITGIGLADD